LLKERGVRLRWAIDEGMLVTEDAIPGLAKPAALIGIAERGALTLELTADRDARPFVDAPVAAGTSAIGMLSEALARLEARQMPFALAGVGRETFEHRRSGDGGSGPASCFRTSGCFGPLVAAEVKKSPSANASFRRRPRSPSSTPARRRTSFRVARAALVNFRLLPGEQQRRRRRPRRCARSRIRRSRSTRATVLGSLACRFDRRSRLFARLREQLLSCTRTSSLRPVLHDRRDPIRGTSTASPRNVYKFSPMRARPEDLKRFHGTNERISSANYVELIQF
jgi:carboxypeptidase PM20D1